MGNHSKQAAAARVFRRPTISTFAVRTKRSNNSRASGTLPNSVNLTGNGEPERLNASRVTGNYFDVFGVAPALGRGFSLETKRLVRIR